jgi:SRSO17 transposase
MDPDLLRRILAGEVSPSGGIGLSNVDDRLRQVYGDDYGLVIETAVGGDCYLRGLMLDGRRKSIQAMAARLPDGNEQNLQQFVNQSTWDPVPVRRRIAERMVPLIGPDAWAIDDVSFPKDGRMSVGGRAPVLRGLGKQANCQVAVSVHAVTDAASVPLQWRLFLPRSGTATPNAGVDQVPDEVGHREKWRLALDTLDELAGWGLVPPVVVADAGYGQNADFRDGLTEPGHRLRRGGPFGRDRPPARRAAHHPGLVRERPQAAARYRDKPSSVLWAAGHGRQAFTEVTWREGSRGPMRSRFLALRVRPAGSGPAAWPRPPPPRRRACGTASCPK